MGEYKLIYLVWRKAHLTPSEFRDEYERHMHLVRYHAGRHFALRHTRNYLVRSRYDARTRSWPVRILKGSSRSFSYDAYVEIVFASEEAYKAYQRSLKRDRRVEKELADSAARFMDTYSTCVAAVAESHTMRN